MFFAGGQNRRPWPELAQQDRPRQQVCPCPEASGDWVGRKDRAEPACWSVALPCCCPELMGWFLLVARETDVSKLTGKPNVGGASHFCLFHPQALGPHAQRGLPSGTLFSHPRGLRGSEGPSVGPLPRGPVRLGQSLGWGDALKLPSAGVQTDPVPRSPPTPLPLSLKVDAPLGALARA